MCICHLPCHPVKPNLAGDQVKNAESHKYLLAWEMGILGGTSVIYLVSKYILLSSVSLLVQSVSI